MAAVRIWVLAALATAALLGACGGEDDAATGPSLRLTDPATVPTATPAAQERVFRFEGGVVVPPSGSPTAAPNAPQPSSRTYTVQPGDTCFGIAQRLGITVEALRNANPSIDAGCTNLRPGEELVVPGASAGARAPATSTPAPGGGGRTYTIRPGDTCYDIARTYGVELSALVSLNGLDCSSLRPGQTIRIP